MDTWLHERRKWTKDNKGAETGESLRDEIVHLKAELKRPKEERAILRKAAVYFAKASE